jgi:hypothetical protein
MAVLVGAQESPDPLNPRSNPAANACYAGGSMEGRCDSDYLWVAGWYLIRLEHSLLRWDDLPQGYRWVKAGPPTPQPQDQEAQQPIGICYNATDSSLRSLRLNLGVKSGSFIHYAGLNCTGPGDPATIVQTRDACTALGLSPSIWDGGPIYGLPGGDYFLCG